MSKEFIGFVRGVKEAPGLITLVCIYGLDVEVYDRKRGIIEAIAETGCKIMARRSKVSGKWTIAVVCDSQERVNYWLEKISQMVEAGGNA